ncbi:hypothetical protein BU17DRAFT_96505 [Hysterangium stoloniferum]|nr:hypothetical protein BU17DRAFT_96505 [Hysterangium stoloniferum]
MSVGPLLTAFTKNNTISRVKKLTLFGYITEAKEYMPWLTRFSNLHALEFQRCTVDAETIALLIPEQLTPSELWLCPLLSTVTYEQSDIPWLAVIKFVESCSLSLGLADEQHSQLLQLRDSSSGTLVITIKDKDPNESKD